MKIYKCTGEDCPECGGELQAITSCKEGELWYDGDSAYCCDCNKIMGTLSVDEDGNSWLND